MIIKTMPGEFFYRALVRGGVTTLGFILTDKYYASREDVCAAYPVGTDIKWPVDEIDRGVIYIPTPEEYQ